MSTTENVLLHWYSSMKKIDKDSFDFFTSKIDFESQIKALFDNLPIIPIFKIL